MSEQRLRGEFDAIMETSIDPRQWRIEERRESKGRDMFMEINGRVAGVLALYQQRRTTFNQRGHERLPLPQGFLQDLNHDLGIERKQTEPEPEIAVFTPASYHVVTEWAGIREVDELPVRMSNEKSTARHMIVGFFDGLLEGPWYDTPGGTLGDYKRYPQQTGLHVVLTNATLETSSNVMMALGDVSVPLTHGNPELCIQL